MRTMVGDGISAELVERIAEAYAEPEWMRELRRRSAVAFARRPLPTWGGDLSGLSLEPLITLPDEGPYLPPPVRYSAPDEVTVVDLRDALRTHEVLVREAFGSVVPPEDNVFAALNSALWQGGWLVHVPAGVVVHEPVVIERGCAATASGCLERVLVIVEPGAHVHIVEEGFDGRGVRATTHATVVEVLVREGALCRYTSLQRWGGDVYNFATKRAAAGAAACMQWIDVNLGACLTMQYPSVYFHGEGGTGEVISLAHAGAGRHQDVGGKFVFDAPRCAGRIVSRAVVDGGGRSTFRPLVKVAAGAVETECAIRVDALRTSDDAIAESHPFIEIDEARATVSRGGTVSQIDERAVAALLPGERAATVRRQAVAEFLEPALDELSADQARLVLEVVDGAAP